MVDEKIGRNEEMLPVVEPSGLVIGQMARSYAHSGSFLLHPVVHLHIIDRFGRVYLQKRAASKKLYPGRWDTAVGGHIEYGESISEALMREAREELNFYDFNPVFLDSYEYRSGTELELICAFVCVGNFKIEPHNIEVDQGRFFTEKEIRESDQDMFTPNFLSEYERFKAAFEALL
ncbi:MAG: NUDIX domain-containing protein [Bacteroidales bacterium]|jgi:isopentenyldiphosphate isomerase|nr:NUDIX domain-containing protein [Bacteroidales bacterium]